MRLPQSLDLQNLKAHNTLSRVTTQSDYKPTLRLTLGRGKTPRPTVHITSSYSLHSTLKIAHIR